MWNHRFAQKNIDKSAVSVFGIFSDFLNKAEKISYKFYAEK